MDSPCSDARTIFLLYWWHSLARKCDSRFPNLWVAVEGDNLHSFTIIICHG